MSGQKSKNNSSHSKASTPSKNKKSEDKKIEFVFRNGIKTRNQIQESKKNLKINKKNRIRDVSYTNSIAKYRK